MKLSASTRRVDPPEVSPPVARLLPLRIFLASALCCLVLVFMVYRPSLDYEFILDDHSFTSHPTIQESGHIWNYFTNSIWAQVAGGPASFYRPVFLLWMRINYVLSGLSPWGWHLLSIAKHILVAVLLGLLAWKLLRHWMAALAAATLFALHPAQTESVSWVTVPDPLIAAGVLVALMCYFRYLEGIIPKEQMRGKKSRRASAARAASADGKWLAASVAAYFVALLAKETAIIFPAVIFAVNLGSRQKAKQDRSRNVVEEGSRWTQALRQTVPFLVVTGIYFVMRVAVLGNMLGAATQHVPWSKVVRSWPAILWFYLKVLFWPWKPYSFADPILLEKFSVHEVLLPLLGLACAAALMSAFCLWAWKRSRRELGDQAAGVESALVVGTLLLVLPILPALNVNALNPGDFLHGRYAYLSVAGLMLLAGTGWRMTKRPWIVLFVPACALTIGFAILTFRQEKQWKDDTTVFTTAHQLAPNNAPVARHLADTYVKAALQLDEEGRCGEAMPIFEKVIRDFPEDWYAWAGLGDCYVQLNEPAKAEESLHRAADLAHDPRVTEHWQELRAQMGLSSSAPPN